MGYILLHGFRITYFEIILTNFSDRKILHKILAIKFKNFIKLFMYPKSKHLIKTRNSVQRRAEKMNKNEITLHFTGWYRVVQHESYLPRNPRSHLHFDHGYRIARFGCYFREQWPATVVSLCCAR